MSVLRGLLYIIYIVIDAILLFEEKKNLLLKYMNYIESGYCLMDLEDLNIVTWLLGAEKPF